MRADIYTQHAPHLRDIVVSFDSLHDILHAIPTSNKYVIATYGRSVSIAL